MDHRAKIFWRQHTNNRRPSQILSQERIAITVGGNKLTHLDKEEVQELTVAPKLQDHWEQKDDVTPSNWKDINWKANKKALKEQPRGTQRWFAKHITRQCGVGKMMGPERRKEWNHDNCPRCGRPSVGNHPPHPPMLPPSCYRPLHLIHN